MRTVVKRGGDFFLVSTSNVAMMAVAGSMPWETMVFPCDQHGEVTSWMEVAADKYPTEALAREGHEKMVADFV